MDAATVYHFEGSGFTLRSFKSVCPDSIANFSSLPGILQEGRAEQYSIVLASKKQIKIKTYPPEKHK